MIANQKFPFFFFFFYSELILEFPFRFHRKIISYISPCDESEGFYRFQCLHFTQSGLAMCSHRPDVSECLTYIP
jgi:hypothetical protein